MWVGAAVDLAPLAFRAPAAHAELDGHYDQRRDQDTEYQARRQPSPEWVAKPVEQRQAGQPEPGVTRMSQDGCQAAQQAWVLSEPQARRKARIDFY